MRARSTPPSLNQACSTDPVSSSGRPDANPISAAISIRVLKMARTDCAQDAGGGLPAVAPLACSSSLKRTIRKRSAQGQNQQA
jgi:hypothetical protein